MKKVSRNENISPEDAKRVISSAVTEAFRIRPPMIAVVGLSGTGKSTTLNALFGQRLPVSHSIRGTVAFTRIELQATPRDSHFEPLPFVFMDAPGLGEDIDRDPEYLDEYEKYLPECDVILWVLAARNRALSQDQAYLSRFSRFKEKIIIGINQVDIVHPNNWDGITNLPSDEQVLELDKISDDRKTRLSKIVNHDIPTVAYSAAHRWRLIELLNLIMSACDSDRKFMFDMLSHVRPDDFVPDNLSERSRKKIQRELARQQNEAREEGISKYLPNFMKGR